jgi:phosphate:Na+ symporter
MTPELDQFAIFSGLFGGLALFLLGMDVLTQALKQVAGDLMKTMLAKMTSNRFVGAATGAVVTILIQSSSITTVLLVGFISAGLMSTAQSVAVIMGANIGSTMTAQLLAFKVTKIALPLIAVGFLVSMIAKREDWRQYGSIVMGLGLVFFGMTTMSDAMKPLRSYQAFVDFMLSLDNRLLAALVGAAFTGIIQSSAATTGILIAMASQGLVSLEAAIAVTLGANIGTCATALLAAIGKPREAVRAAVVHTLFNVAGVIIWIGFVSELANLARAISPTYESMTGSARSAAEMPRQIANVHTFFNVVNTALFIGFTTQFTRLVEWLVPDRALEDIAESPRFIDDQLLVTPSIALDAARREIVRLGVSVTEMLRGAIPVATSGTRVRLDQLSAMDRPIDVSHRQIIGYLRSISLRDLSSDQSDRLMGLIRIANDLEHIGDQIGINLVTSAKKRLDENVVISPRTAKAIGNLHSHVVEALQRAVSALEREDEQAAAQVRAMKKDFGEIVEELALHEVSRLKADEPKRLLTYAREMELIEIFDDIFKTTRRIARTQLAISEAKSSANGEPTTEAETASYLGR